MSEGIGGPIFMMQLSIILGRDGNAVLRSLNGGQHQMGSAQTDTYNFQYIFKIDPF